MFTHTGQRLVAVILLLSGNVQNILRNVTGKRGGGIMIVGGKRGGEVSKH